MNKIIKNSKASSTHQGCDRWYSRCSFWEHFPPDRRRPAVTAVYGPYQTDTQCWIDVESAHENGQTVTQGCQWRSINGQWGYYFVAY